MLTISKSEKVFDIILGMLGEELQSTGTYLKRANSIEDMSKELDMSLDDIKENLFGKDIERFENHTGAIVWADTDKEDFFLLLDDTEEAIREFLEDLSGR